jgi:hypothetical protein
MPRLAMPIDIEEVLRMMAAGDKDEIIARAFHCHANTIRKHRKRKGLSRRGPNRPRMIGRGWECVGPIVEAPLPPEWGGVRFADVGPKRLDAETHWHGWHGMPSREALTHRGYGQQYSSGALDL